MELGQNEARATVDSGAAESFKWEGWVGMIAYASQFQIVLDQQLADRVADQIRTGQGFQPKPQEFARAIEIGLAQDGPLGGGMDDEHSQDEFRAYLGMLHHALTSPSGR